MNLAATFAAHAAEHGHFDRVADKLSKRPDLHALLLLDRLNPGEHEILANVNGWRIELNIETARLVATEAQLVELMRCGVKYDVEGDSLYLEGE